MMTIQDNIDDFSVDVNTLNNTVDNMQKTIFNMRQSVNVPLNLHNLLDMKPEVFKGVIILSKVPKSNMVELTYPRDNGKKVRTHRETLLFLFMLLPKKFSAKEVSGLLKTVTNIEINPDASPHLIMKFFSVAFSDNCKIVNVGKKSKLVIEKI